MSFQPLPRQEDAAQAPPKSRGQLAKKARRRAAAGAAPDNAAGAKAVSGVAALGPRKTPAQEAAGEVAQADERAAPQRRAVALQPLWIATPGKQPVTTGGTHSQTAGGLQQQCGPQLQLSASMPPPREWAQCPLTQVVPSTWRSKHVHVVQALACAGQASGLLLVCVGSDEATS